MKKYFSFVLLIALLATLACNASPTRIGRLYDYIDYFGVDSKSTNMKSAIDWMKNNFDAENIPIISRSIHNANFSITTGQLPYSFDSAYRYNAAETKYRAFAWMQKLSQWPVVLYYPYWWFVADGGGPIGTHSNFGTYLNTMYSTLADLETENGIFEAVYPTTITSSFKDGYITGRLTYTAPQGDLPVAFVENFKQYLMKQIQITLVEGYHKFGNEEHWFMPREVFYTGNVGGMQSTMTAAGGSIDFKFAVDPSWNTKYLYVVGTIEAPGFIVEGDGNAYLDRMLLDVAVDRVVNVKTAETNTNIKLDLVHNNDADKFKKVANGSTTNIIYKVTNPTSSAVKAIVYIDGSTSRVEGWKITSNKDTLTLAPSSNTTITISAVAPNRNGMAAGYNLSVLPINTADNQNPIISNVNTVLATDSIRALGLFGDIEMGRMSIAITGNPYYNNIALLPFRYCSNIPVDAFEAYIVSYVTKNTHTQFTPATTIDQYYAINNNFNDYFTNEQNLIMYNSLKLPELNFLNGVVESGKHLALFTDASLLYAQSNYASSEEKAAYTKLFQALGVSLKASTYTANFSTHIPLIFEVRGSVATDSLCSGINDGEVLSLLINDGTPLASSSPIFVDFNLINPGVSAKLFHYATSADQSGAKAAVVKTVKGQQKLLTAGFGWTGASLLNNGAASNKKFFKNLTDWWFGYRNIPKPSIASSGTYFDFGLLTVDSSQPSTQRIVLRNTATNDFDVLSIYSVDIETDPDGSFTILRQPASEILPGSSDTLIIQFLPKNPIEYNNIAVTVQSNDPIKPAYSLFLSGEGKAPAGPLVPKIYVDATDLFHNFTPTPVALNSQKLRKSIFVTNAGGAPLTLTAVDLTAETDKNIYSLEFVKLGTLGTYEEMEFDIVFNPTAAGFFEGALVIKSNDPTQPELLVEFIGRVASSMEDEIAEVFNCEVSPNPANAIATVSFNVLGETQHSVEFNIRDISGRLLRAVSAEDYLPGTYVRNIDVQALPAGSYFLEFVVDAKSSTRALKIVR
ncbi:MAG: choice-of-anchor D domain-containing protein [Ignavibacteria bacterium]|jgi:hypothetical protein|nr:choice-of-anchor D domain-containing protein [Ignavibacteria bacterium]